MTFCYKVTVFEAKVFIISQRSSLDDDPITLDFVNGGGLSCLIILLGLKSIRMELLALIALLRLVPIT